MGANLLTKYVELLVLHAKTLESPKTLIEII